MDESEYIQNQERCVACVIIRCASKIVLCYMLHYVYGVLRYEIRDIILVSGNQFFGVGLAVPFVQHGLELSRSISDHQESQDKRCHSPLQRCALPRVHSVSQATRVMLIMLWKISKHRLQFSNNGGKQSTQPVECSKNASRTSVSC